jgi:tetratricopeptide (TPR) repeat protein
MIFVCACAVPVQASQDPLPAKAQQAMAKGIAATKIQDYELAIKYFKEAQEAAPSSPEVLFNLAFAYNKAGGRELLAIAWYRAFLGMSPGNDKRCDQVRQRIIELDIQVESTVRHLIKIAEETVWGFARTERDIYQYIGRAQAAIGDFDAARKSLNSAIRSYRDKIDKVETESKGKQGAITQNYSDTIVSIALSQWKYGDSEGAIKTIDWALTEKDYHTSYGVFAYCILYDRRPLKELKLFVNRDWEKMRYGQVNRVFFIGGEIYEKLYHGRMERFLDDDDRRWYDFRRSLFIDYSSPSTVIGIREAFYTGQIFLLESWWHWDGASQDVWQKVAKCSSIQGFDQNWHELVEKRKSEDPAGTVVQIAELAKDMAQVLHFFRKCNAYHSNLYWGKMWR